MIQKDIRRFTSIIIILVSILACDLPAEFAPQPVSSPDPNALSTIVAGTASAAAAQTALAAPTINVPTQSPTETAIPTGTATPTPRISTEGTSLQKQSDGSYVFTDYQGGYIVVIPPGWLVVRINEQEYINAWILPEASDLKVQHFLAKFQLENANYYRVLGVDIIPEHMKTDAIPYFDIEWDRITSATLQQEVDNLKKFVPKFVAYKVTYADIGTTSTQIPMGIIESNWQELSISGEPKTVYQKQVLFKLKTGILAFVLSADKEIKDELFSSLDLMTDQIKMLP